ncbi:hypothetical protein BH11GEM2_BH11GEM2_14580 [soil metagenome]
MQTGGSNRYPERKPGRGYNVSHTNHLWRAEQAHRWADSLLLTRAQEEAFRKADVIYRAEIDSLWLSLATNFIALGDHYDVASAVRRQEDALAQGQELRRRRIRATLGAILTAIQLQLMPHASTYRSETPLVQAAARCHPDLA